MLVIRKERAHHATKEEAPLDLALLESGKGLPESGANFGPVSLEVGIDVVDLLDDVLVAGIQVSVKIC